MKKALAILLTLVLILSTCVIALAENNDETLFTYWDEDAIFSGIQNNPVMNAIAEKTGVRLDVVRGDKEKFMVLLAAGDLPDILYLHHTTAKDLIESGGIIQLDDLVAEYAPYINENYPLDYSRQKISEDGKLWFIPIRAFVNKEGEKVPSFYGSNITMNVRWDIYAQQNYPQIETEEQFLDFLKAAQDANPKTADGKTVYALGAWSDWGVWPWWVPYCFNNGIGELSGNTIIFKHMDGSVEGMYNSEDFWNAIRFYNRAFNMGLLDPESFTQTYDDYLGKQKNGQYLVMNINGSSVQSSVNEALATIDPHMGYENIPTHLRYMAPYDLDTPNGWGGGFAACISSNCKDPAKAIQFLNYCFSPEGSRTLYSGVEGIHWVKNEDGTYSFTEEYKNGLAADPNYKSNQGIGFLKYLCGISPMQIYDGDTVDLNLSPSLMVQNMQQVDKDYCAYWGEKYGQNFDYPGRVVEYQLNQGIYFTSTNPWDYFNYYTTPSDDIFDIITNVQLTAQNEVPLVVMATADELEASIEQVKQMLTDIGYGEAVTSLKENYANALAEYEAALN